jgi:hypothetical protein
MPCCAGISEQGLLDMDRTWQILSLVREPHEPHEPHKPFSSSVYHSGSASHELEYGDNGYPKRGWNERGRWLEAHMDFSSYE